MLSRYSVKRPYTVLVGVVLILILGYVSFTRMQTDLLPDMTLPYAIVYTTYPGASPEEVETVVTRPVEQSMATISNIETIRSVSSENVSTVILEFSQSANMDAVTIEMRENLDQIEGYWDDSVGSPIIMKLNPDMLPVMVAAVEADGLSQSELTDLVNNSILPELESIEGVASVSATGTIEEQVQVTLREDKIKEVNRKVRKALDKQFEEAQSEMEEAQSELDEGKEQLESGQTQLADGSAAAQGQISSGSSQMLQGQIELNNRMAQIDAALAQMNTSEQDLLAKEQELIRGEQALLALPGQQAQMETQLAQVQQGVTLLTQAPETLEQLDTILKALEEKMAQVQQGESDAAQTDTGASGQSESAPSSASARQADAPQTEAAQNGLETPPESAPQPETAAQPETVQTQPAIQQPETAAMVENTQTNTKASPEQQEDVLDTIFTQEELDGLLKGVEEATELAALQEEWMKYHTQKLQLLAQLKALGVDTSKEGEELDAQITGVKTQLETTASQLQSGIAQMQTTIDDMPAQLETIAAGKTAVTQGKQQISDGRKELEAARKKLQDALNRLTGGQAGVSQALGELSRTQINATIEMAVGKAELNAGQKELDAALEQIEAQKDAAYDQTDVTQMITAEMIKGILAAQNFTMPAGYVTEDGIDFLVRVGDKLDETEQLNDLLILDLHMDGLEPIRLSDVADVAVIDDSDEIYAKVNGNAGVMFTMQKQSGYSTGEVSERIKKKFADLEETESVHIIKLMDQGVYIDLVVDSVIENMLSGAVLAIIVLLIFLGSLRPTLVIACSIPISIMTAVVMMYFSKITLNIISLSGLALGIGMLVDNSIVVIENIYRLRAEGYSVKRAATEGATQVAGAIAASTLTTICVFLPIVFTEGITRQLFVDMGLTIAYSLIASLAVALTLVPAMGAGLLKKSKEKRSRIFTAVQNGYAKLLGWSLKVKILVLLLAFGLLAVSARLAVSRGTAFMPEMESTQVSVTLNMPEGTQLSETAAMADQVMERILTIPDVTDVGAMTGASGALTMGNSGSSADSASFYVLLSEDMTITNDELVKEITEKTKDLNCDLSIETSTMDMSALGGSGISVNIKGRDLDQLKRMAQEVAKIVEGVEGTEEVSDGIEEKTLELRLVVDKDKAMSYQLTTAQIYQFLQEKLADAASVTTLSALSKDYPVFVLSDADETLTREKIKKLKITGKDKENKDVDVALSKLVTFVDTEGFSSINREAQSRYVTVSAQIADGYNIGLVSADVSEALKEYEVPQGYSLEMAGEDETINEAMEQVGLMLVLALAFMYLIMVAQFQSLLAPFIIMFTVPLAFTGGLFALYLTNNSVSVIAMIGFVMLSGIIVNNGIVLVDYINQLRRGGMDKKSAIVEAGRARLRPIIMTALTTILGLTTMALGMGMGADMVQPMAIVTIGGLTYGTLLTLFVVPCIYDLFHRNKDMSQDEIV